MLRGTKERPSGHRAVGRKAGSEVLGRRRSGGERRCRKAATKPLEIPRVTTLILKLRREDGGRLPARAAGRGEVKTRKLGRLPGESPGTEVRNARAEAEAVHLPFRCSLPRQIPRLVVGVSQDPGRFVAEVCGGRFEKSLDWTTRSTVLNCSVREEPQIRITGKCA
jgi:hypothetical protein